MNTTSYSFSIPEAAWDAFTETIPREKNIDDAIVELVAQQAKQRNGQLTDRQRQQIRFILEEEVHELD